MNNDLENIEINTQNEIDVENENSNDNQKQYNKSILILLIILIVQIVIFGLIVFFIIKQSSTPSSMYCSMAICPEDDYSNCYYYDENNQKYKVNCQAYYKNNEVENEK